MTPDLSYPYFDRLAAWQRQRPLWLAGGLLGVFMEVFSVLYFQVHLGLRPCLYCIYIREATLLIGLGGLLAALWPRVLRFIGYPISLTGSFIALFFAFKLETQTVNALYWPEAYSSCGIRVGYKFGRYLAQKWPTHFSPLGQCGIDSNWRFLSFNQAEILIIIYLLALIGLLLGLSSNFKPRARGL
ncbi:MAG: disulfide bond formation protein B [Deltaproteobacteria bacterium]|jgi:disulfide bond formation protein DsbB|nr:disulfide bond formation protein B [Deltaproteobacteria bacterium]